MMLCISRLCALAIVLLLPLFLLDVPAAAQSNISAQAAGPAASSGFKVLYRFCNLFACNQDHDGYYPTAGVTLDPAGNVFGTTTAGGGCENINCGGSGTIFKFPNHPVGGRPIALENDLSSYGAPPDPSNALLRDSAGNLYGTTVYGGTISHGGFCGDFGCGAVYVNGFSVYSFCPTEGCPDGAFPTSELVRDSAGNLYGTTNLGGANRAGAVYKLDSNYVETVLYSFCSAANCVDGANPNDLIQDAAGNFYGTTASGGANNAGTVFKIDTTGAETVLYNFCSRAKCVDGQTPLNVLIDSAGKFYGTTQQGGYRGSGVIYKLAPNLHEQVIYSFCSAANCADGAAPNPVIRDASGNFYGTTRAGGATDHGTILQVDSTGHATIYYNLCSTKHCADGDQPWGRLAQDEAGFLYGTTMLGGNHVIDDFGFGVIFKQATRFKVKSIVATSDINPVQVNQQVTLTAVVSGAGHTPTGTVTFKKGQAILGTVALTNGQASLITVFPKRQTAAHIQAEYSGDTNYLAIRSVPIVQVVNQ